MHILNPDHVIAERMRRQHLTEPLTDPDEFVELFRALQPVSPVYFSMPGDPPGLTARTRFDNRAEAGEMRSQGNIVKGRFLNGNIGYVLAEELDIYAAAFRRPLKKLSAKQELILEKLRAEGPLTPRRIKEETGLLNKEIMPVLHRLQTAFLVFEDQTDSDWERGWSAFENEWPDIELDDAAHADAVVQVLLRFLKAHVFATDQQIKDWSGLPVREVAATLKDMAVANLVIQVNAGDLGKGWVCAEDADLPEADSPRSVVMLHRSDYLFRSHTTALKEQFAGEEILQYLLIDGRFRGAVVGHWRIGPHFVDDILVHLPAEAKLERRTDILNEVAKTYHPPESGILHYDGSVVEGYGG